MLSKYQVILWDFDGVILDSMPVREKGFELVLVNYPTDQVERLLVYHKANGGLSRYVKFRYFFETIRNEPVTNEDVLQFASGFSEIMLAHLINPNLLIHDSLNFIKQYHHQYEMHIVSGSDGEELRKICKGLGIDHFFKTISGSPTPKKQLVANLLHEYKYAPANVVLIGDSGNDWEAAVANQIHFMGYNNKALRENGEYYIESFGSLV